LGFFTLVVLVVEGILGSVAAFSGTERSTALYGMLSIIGALIIVVAGFAVFRPEALSGIRQEQKLEGGTSTGTTGSGKKPGRERPTRCGFSQARSPKPNTSQRERSP
jgi:hypothetical protein